MSRFGRPALAFVFCLSLIGRPARAGVENTHHDMRLYNQVEERSVCEYCHVPHGASGEGLLREEGRFQNELGRVGSFCYTCHDGTVVPTALIEAPDGTVGIEALTRSHGLVVRNIGPKTGGLESIDAVRASGLVAPDAQTGALPERMECTACHDPHNSAYPPFLRAPIDQLCQKCHAGRDGKGSGRFGTVDDAGPANGPHPIGMPIAYSGKDRKRPGQQVPEIRFNAVAPKLRAPGFTAEDQADPNKHWQTGGHLVGYGVEPATGGVMCSTCHSAHATGTNLLVIPFYRTDHADDPLCNGCHGKAESPQNPGGTAFYHPAERESSLPYTTSTTPSRTLDIRLPSDWPLARDGSLLCATCHRAHQGRLGAKCLRNNSEGKKYICDLCHRPEEEGARALSPPPKNSHHVTTPTDKSATLRGRTLSWWSGAAGDPGDLADGLTCVDCHTELAKSAHNW